MWPGASAALPAPRETGLHCWTPRGLLAPEPRTLPDVLGDPGQVSRSPSARRTERHPGQRMELGPRPPHGTQAACPSARAPAPTPEAAPSQRMSLPPPAPSAALPRPRGSPPMPSGSCDCGAGTRRGAGRGLCGGGEEVWGTLGLWSREGGRGGRAERGRAGTAPGPWVQPDMHAPRHASVGRGFLPSESFVLEERDKNRREIKTSVSRTGRSLAPPSAAPPAHRWRRARLPLAPRPWPPTLGGGEMPGPRAPEPTDPAVSMSAV